jgi:hypothetical protein
MMSENVDELKKKVLELRYMIDKKDGEIKKYQKALMIAADEVVANVNCLTCPIASICESEYEYTGRTCAEMFVEEWEEEAGIE